MDIVHPSWRNIYFTCKRPITSGDTNFDGCSPCIPIFIPILWVRRCPWVHLAWPESENQLFGSSQDNEPLQLGCIYSITCLQWWPWSSAISNAGTRAWRVITYVLSQLSHLMHENGHPKSLVLLTEPPSSLLFTQPLDHSVSALRTLSRESINRPRFLFPLFCDISYGSTLGTGRLIVVRVPIQKW